MVSYRRAECGVSCGVGCEVREEGGVGAVTRTGMVEVPLLSQSKHERVALMMARARLSR